MLTIVCATHVQQSLWIKTKFAKFEKYKDNQPNIIESLAGWFNKMPHVDLHNYKEHGALAIRLSYIGISRQELYEVYIELCEGLAGLIEEY